MVFARNSNALWTELDGQLVLMDIETGAYFEMAGVGGDIWRFLESPRSESEIVDSIVERYRVERPDCEQDVRAFLDKLVAARMVSEQASATDASLSTSLDAG